MKNWFFLLTFLLNGVLLAGIDSKIYKNGEINSVSIDNDFYSIVIVPDFGGRIFKWEDKISGVKIADAAIPEKNNEMISPSGLLDDRGNFWKMPYKFSRICPDEKTVIIYLSVFDAARKIKIDRKMTFHAASPVVNVQYKYENHSEIPVFGFDLGQRNFIMPSGQGITPIDRYYLPTTHAVRSIKGFTLDGMNQKELSGKLKTNIGGSWHAFLSGKFSSGLAVSHRDNWYSGWYMWKDRVDYPTYEWMYGDLPAGYSRETAFDLIQVNGFERISYADNKIIADMRMKNDANKLDIELKIQRIADIPHGAELTTEIRQVGSKWQCIAPPIPLNGDTFRQNFNLPSEGVYEIRQKITAQKSTYAAWHDAFAYGENSEYEALFKPDYRTGTEFKLIPGYQAKAPATLECSPAAKERNFAIVNPPADNKYNECEKLTVNMLRNEFESREILLYNLFPGGDFEVDFQAPSGVELKIIPEKKVRIDAKSSGMTTRYGRILDSQAKISGEGISGVWLVFGGKNMKSGNYKFPVTFRNKNNAKAVLQIELKVSDIAIPKRKLIMLESEFALPREITQNRRLMQEWLGNMANHQVDFFQYGKFGITDGEIKELDAILDLAIPLGITRFKAARYDISDPKPEEVANWRRLADYLHSKGIQDKDIFVKILDEQPFDKFQQMAKTAHWLKKIGFRPFSTFDLLFAKPEEMEVLYPEFDMYQGGFVGEKTIAMRQKDGLLKAGDLVGNYTGWGCCYQSYETMMNFGVQTAVMEFDFFHNHEYMRGDNRRLIANIVMINPDNLPLDSAAHEGLRDGMELANMAALCRSWFKRLDSKPEYAKLLAESKDKYHYIFGSLFRKKAFAYNDNITDVIAAEADFKDYIEAKRLLIEILENLKMQTASGDFAQVVWNNMILADDNTIFTASGPEADFFTDAFFKRFKLGNQKRSNGITIKFNINSELKQSYRIDRGENNLIIISGSNAANLQTAAINFIATMDYSGVWE